MNTLRLVPPNFLSNFGKFPYPTIHMKILTRLLGVGLLCGAALVRFAAAQPLPDPLAQLPAAFPAVDALFRQAVAQHHLPSVVYGVVAGGQLVHTGSVGVLDVDRKNPATSQSVYRIASMTKSVVALAILQLRDAGKLQLDDPVHRYLPELKGQQSTPDAPEITIRHLLTHAAGFPEDNPWGDRQLAVSDQAMRAMIKRGLSFSTAPGVAYEYSNLGFAMLGYIVAKVAGQPYQTYTQQHIFAPLGMASTYWDYRQVPARQLAHGYRWHGGQWVEQPLLADGAYGAMGGLLTTLEDFAKYMALHQSAWPPRGGPESPVLRRSSLREMHQPWNFSALNPAARAADGRPCPNVSAYGYGLRWIRDCDQKVNVGHSGGLPGFGSNWKILPDLGVGVVAFSNLTYAPMSALNARVLDTLVALAQLKPRPVPVSPVLAQRQAELASLLPGWENAAAKGIFADNFFLDYFPAELKAEAEALFAKAGKIVRVGPMVAENQLRGTFTLVGEKATLAVSFTLSPENPPLIQEYHIWEVGE
jgi:CubicO group peptidase (beta-lactamase class C family)